MTDRYAVIGNPIQHSKSPRIHAAFARQTSAQLEYGVILGDPADFEAQVTQLRAEGFCGLNVTLPFKERALALAQQSTPRAALAGAANTLVLAQGGILADNTDGVGLMRDLQDRLRVTLSKRRVLVLGAGGAVRGILAPLLAAGPGCLHLCNRTAARAETLLVAFAAAAAGSSFAAVEPAGLAAQSAYDLVINGTSGSLSGAALDLPANVFASTGLAYDLAYRADGDTPFLAQARAAGVGCAVDGLGMLVEQAAEAFLVWRGVRPATDEVLRDLRASLHVPQ